MIDKAELVAIVDKHDSDEERNRPQRQRYRSALRTRYWSDENDLTMAGGLLSVDPKNTNAHDLPIRIEFNKILPWLQSFVSGLYYKGARTLATPDRILEDGQKPVDPQIPRAVASILDRMLNTTEIQEIAETLYALGLMYGPGAFQIGLRPEPDDGGPERAIDAVWAEFVPPWECVWDRESTPRTMRYAGRIHHLSNTDVKARFDHDVAEELLISRPDFLLDGIKTDSRTPPDKGEVVYVRVLEFYDLTAELETKEGKTIRGQYEVYLVDKVDSGGTKLTSIVKGKAMRMHWPGGLPALDLVPVILESTPEHPMLGIPPVAPVYEINSEENFMASVVINSARRDAARVLLVEEEGLDEKALADITRGKDWVIAQIQGLAQTTIQWLDSTPIASSIKDAVGLLTQAGQEVVNTSSFTRGQQGEYLSASEATILSGNDETSFGRYRKRMDTAMAQTASLYLRVLMEAMKDRKQKHLNVQMGQETIKVTVEDLDRRWKVSIIDTATNPVAENQLRQDFMLIHQVYLDLIVLMGAEDTPPAAAEAARLMAKELVRRWDFPPDFDPDELVVEEVEEEPLPEELPPQPQAAQGGIGGIDPAVAEAVSDPAVAQAIVQNIP